MHRLCRQWIYRHASVQKASRSRRCHCSRRGSCGVPAPRGNGGGGRGEAVGCRCKGRGCAAAPSAEHPCPQYSSLAAIDRNGSEPTRREMELGLEARPSARLLAVMHRLALFRHSALLPAPRESRRRRARKRIVHVHGPGRFRPHNARLERASCRLSAIGTTRAQRRAAHENAAELARPFGTTGPGKPWRYTVPQLSSEFGCVRAQDHPLWSQLGRSVVHPGRFFCRVIKCMHAIVVTALGS